MSIAAENVVGGLLIDNAAFWRIADIVKAEDFPPTLRGLFIRMSAAIRAGEAYDSVTAYDDGFEDAISLANVTASTANIVGWAKRVAEASETVRIRAAGQRIAQCETYVEAQELLAEVRTEQSSDVKSVQDGLSDFLETLQARFDSDGSVTGVPTGIDGLDELTSGWQPGNLIVLVGETSMGKSALAMQMAIAAAKYGKARGKAALYFSLEMTVGELTERAVANLANIPLAWMTHPKTAPEHAMTYITEGSAAFRDLPLYFDDRSGLTLEQIVSRSLQVHMRTPLCAIFVDYMHIMGRARRNDVGELGGIAAGLKNLSKTIGVPVIALHQLNRANSGQRPTLGDVRASGEIAEAANTVIAVYRSEVAQPLLRHLHGYAEILIRKQRQGRRDVRAWAKANLANMRFESCQPPENYSEEIMPDPVAEKPKGQTSSGGFGARKPPRSGQGWAE